jgi:hypothetical protein
MKQVVIVWSESSEDAGYQVFEDTDAFVAEKALSDAEAKGARGCQFDTIAGYTYHIRTDKYLYWTVREKE